MRRRLTAKLGEAGQLRISAIIGRRLDPDLHERLHRLEHRGTVDILQVQPDDMQRRRFRATSEAGRTIEITLPRDQSLFDGAVLWLDGDSALVLRAAAQRWLRLTPATHADALAVGYHAGNLHWRVRFDGDVLLVALEAPAEAYLARLGDVAARLGWHVVDDASC